MTAPLMAIEHTKIPLQLFRESLISKTVSKDFSEMVDTSWFLHFKDYSLLT
jgi:hypothetical protein